MAQFFPEDSSSLEDDDIEEFLHDDDVENLILIAVFAFLGNQALGYDMLMKITSPRYADTCLFVRVI
jgi:hypothetical protein